MLRSFVLVVFLFGTGFIFGQNSDEVEVEQDSIWDTNSTLSLNLQKTGFTNWAQGGESSIAYGSVLTFTANRTTDVSTWKNNVRLGIGWLKRNGFEPRKNTDLLILTSAFGFDLSKHWELSGGIDFRSQFAPGYKYSADPVTGDEIEQLVSDFLSPAYFQPSIGITYKKGKTFTAALAPISNKMTIVKSELLSNMASYGLDSGAHIRSQMGTTINLSFNDEVMDNVVVKTNLLLFGDYSKYSEWDVNYDLFIDMKVNKWIATNFLLQMIYDDDIRGNSEKEGVTGPALQLRHVLNVGLTIKLVSD